MPLVPRPNAATSAITMISVGNELMTSMARSPAFCTSLLRVMPMIEPTIVPTSSGTETAAAARMMSMRAASKVRANTSRPR